MKARNKSVLGLEANVLKLEEFLTKVGSTFNCPTMNKDMTLTPNTLKIQECDLWACGAHITCSYTLENVQIYKSSESNLKSQMIAVVTWRRTLRTRCVGSRPPGASCLSNRRTDTALKPRSSRLLGPEIPLEVPFSALGVAAVAAAIRVVPPTWVYVTLPFFFVILIS